MSRKLSTSVPTCCFFPLQALVAPNAAYHADSLPVTNVITYPKLPWDLREQD